MNISSSHYNGGNKYGIYSGSSIGALTINLVGTNTVTAKGITPGKSYGIWSWESLTISGTDTATLTAEGGAADSSFGIYGNNTITISDSAQVSATGGTAVNESYGIFGRGDITISAGAQVTGTGGTTTNGFSRGIYGNTIAISGGTVTAKSGTATTSQAIAKQPDFKGYTNYQWRTAKEGAFTPSTTKDYEWANTHTYVEIKPQPTTINYDLWVGGVQVTSENKDGIIGEGITGTATYDPDTNTLTLNGVTIEKSYDYFGNKLGIYSRSSIGALTINLVGTNTITAEDATVSDKNSYGIFVTGSLTISGTDTATLTAKGGSSSNSSYGIYGDNTITISDSVQVTAKGGTATGSSGRSCGIFSNVTITISGSANVKATGGEATSSSYGIFGVSTITISGGTVTATGGTATGSSGRSCGIFSNVTVAISGGTVTAKSGTATGISGSSYGIFGVSTITISGGTVTAKSGTASATSLAINIQPFLTGYTNYQWRTASDVVFTSSTTKAYELQNDHTYVEIKPQTAAPTYTVTFNPNGGTVSETSRSVAPGAAVGTLPTPARSGSYSFDGWYTAASGGTQIFASTTINANVTYYAHWTYTGGGGSGSGGGGSSDDSSSPIIVTPPATDKPNSPTQGEIKVSGTVDSKGNITVNITDKTVTDAFDKALADAKKNGNEQNGITVVLHVDTGSKTASNVTVNLPKTVQDTIIAQKIVNTIVVVDNPDIRIGMDLASVQAINNQARADVNLTATRMNNSALTGDAASAIGARPVFDLKVNYGSNQVQNFGAGSVSVTIPYTLGANETPGNIQAVYVDANGRMQWLVNSVYDSLNGVLRFSTNHFSTYGVGNKQGAPVFSDVSTHWAADDIAFVANRGLLSGTSKTTFSPNTAMTRGMFVTALGRLANANVSGYTKSSFNDVKRDAYYMGYIEWANKNNIVNGVGNGRFAPDQSITREQMAVIMGNYAKAIGFALPKARAEITFADNAKISAYAKEAVKQMQMAGVISGKNSNLFDPQGTATRAEVSAVLRRFVELAISSNTAQGWTMNDSGKWMYYENGKPLTGKQDIDGATYTFDQYGVTADVPKNLRYTTYTVQKGDSFWRIAHKLGCTMSELERLNNKSRFSLIHPGDVLRVPEK